MIYSNFFFEDLWILKIFWTVLSFLVWLILYCLFTSIIFYICLTPIGCFLHFWFSQSVIRNKQKKSTFYEPREGRRVGWRFESLLWRRGGGLDSFFIYCFLLNMYMYMYSRHIYMTVIKKKKKNIFKIFWIDAFFSYLYKTLFTIFSIYYSIKVNKIEWIKIKHLDNKYKSYQICWNMVFTMQLTVHRETIKTTAAVGCERLA